MLRLYLYWCCELIIFVSCIYLKVFVTGCSFFWSKHSLTGKSFLKNLVNNFGHFWVMSMKHFLVITMGYLWVISMGHLHVMSIKHFWVMNMGHFRVMSMPDLWVINMKHFWVVKTRHFWVINKKHCWVMNMDNFWVMSMVTLLSNEHETCLSETCMTWNMSFLGPEH